MSMDLKADVMNAAKQAQRHTINKDELFYDLQCALMHDLKVCQECGKCDGHDFADIRLNLVSKLKEFIYG